MLPCAAARTAARTGESFLSSSRRPPRSRLPAGNKKSRCEKLVRKKPHKCAKRGFQGKCRASCDAHWSDIEFCTPPGAMSWPGSKEELLAQMGAPAKKPPAGSVDWTDGIVACTCDTYEDDATEEDEWRTGLCQKTLAEDDGRGKKIKRCRSLHVNYGTTAPMNRCAGDWEYCTAHPPSPAPPPPQ